MGESTRALFPPDVSSNTVSYGCSSVCVNESFSEILGHTEDAPLLYMGHYYLVSAHIIEDKPQGKWAVKEEKFVSLCYPGLLPGFTMNYNHHGLVYSINVIHARDAYLPKTPEFFLCRALLSARDVNDLELILRDKGMGAGMGFSVNATFIDEPGQRIFYNFEVGAAIPGTDESIVNKLTINQGENSFHCNKYLRLQIPEWDPQIITGSNNRHDVFNQSKCPKTKKDVIHLLSHQRTDNFTIFRDYDENSVEPIVTLAIGIFDLINRTWSIYTDKPELNDPLIVLTLQTIGGDQLNTIDKLIS